MGVYICTICDRSRDNDFIPCFTWKTRAGQFELICNECVKSFTEIFEEDKERELSSIIELNNYMNEHTLS